MSTLTGQVATRLRTYGAVRGYVGKVCFKTGPPGLVGTELEWIVVHPEHPHDPVPIPLLGRLLDARGPLPNGSTLTFEPGGQLELSSPPLPGPSACWRALRADAAHARAALAAANLTVLPTGLDPYRPPERQLRTARYESMAAYFEAIGADTGPQMMNSTAAVQVNLDIGRDAEHGRRRWQVLHAVGPAMVAAFANSPVHAGADTGWKSGRQRIWQRLDPCRTEAPHGRDPARAWTDYALDARLMLGRRAERRPGEAGTFRDWLDSDAPPTRSDLDQHLTTLFPPVRPRGWFEVRYLDAQPEHWWPVPVAVLSALVDDPVACAEATAACAGPPDWEAAARDGLAAPGLQDKAFACFDAALDALRRSRNDPELVERVEDFVSTYVARGRCPADEPIPEVP